MIDTKTAYPARYYAAFNPTDPQPTAVTGWYDTWSMGSLATVPPVASLIAVSAEDWADTTRFRLPTGRGVQDGNIVDYLPPLRPLSLSAQAKTALIAARQTVWAEYGVLNDPTPEAWVTYLKALRALADGQDTSSTTLPEAPA
ncbi:hypothetical protein [Acetobacter orleanensis]|uniref:Uncharacterized protein n=1 Tax=Acetobacter orleanensis TaxID=104099 RepID=A0A4Y3TMK8_9PROT|nr:hypothetical protein [Acetobacter orleanensis]KXV63938.1 hypothetical protein AD949_06445 [Acetobacter orleanensis]PCD79711.1 hypothetical protein CO710_05765 [Acetobacter orleanensis]GAN69274.1 hypothetical protein Abol_030_039 [Acetobacter orleanensis JCM 7639]GBR28261.1 hypothetical protein AA0473_1689 [Acetobacter orleanensis NRIC 0473]GEB82200.1 hypothetical protein AOR01nite_06770 [Acetobacter orleanensis]